MRTTGLLLITCMVLLSGCRHSYVIRGKDVTRTLRSMGKGSSAAKTNIAVNAQDKKSGEQVWLELRADDGLYLRRCAALEGGETIKDWDMLKNVPATVVCEEMEFTAPGGAKQTLTIAGLSAAGAGLMAQWLPVLLADLILSGAVDQSVPAWMYAPYYGSMRMMIEFFEDAGQDEDAWLSGLWMGLSFTAQVVGPVLALTGVILPRERLLDSPYDLEPRHAFVPTVTPFGQGGLLLTWTY